MTYKELSIDTELYRLRAEVTALRAAQARQWQPIETAPKAKPVLVGYGRARYIAYQTDQPAPMTNTWRHMNGEQLPVWPTHWQLLPDPPETEQ